MLVHFQVSCWFLGDLLIIFSSFFCENGLDDILKLLSVKAKKDLSSFRVEDLCGTTFSRWKMPLL